MFNVLIEATKPQGGGLTAFLPFILMFAILYFLIIRPQRKKQRDHQTMLGNLKINDVVVTNGGIIGKIVNIKKDKNTVVIRVDETAKTKIEFQKSAVVGILSEEKKG